MLTSLFFVMATLLNKLQVLREDDRGMTTEAMIVTAILAAGAIGAATYIMTAVQDKGSDIGDDIEGALAWFR
jgi:NADH:ubiquinone oxidoreductase subunit 6 (subunit J)